MTKKKFSIDFLLLGILILFFIISYLTISSARIYLPSYLGNLEMKQALFYLLGFILAGIIILLSNEKIYRLIYVLYGLGNLSLLLLLFFGSDINGSKCWFMIPGIGSIQPSEFMKIILILTLSILTENFFQKKKVTIKEEFFFLIKVLVIVLIPSILTFLEPDTGAILMYFMITLGILFLSPLRRRWFIAAISSIIIVLGVIFSLYFWKQDVLIKLVGTDIFYRMDRILDWHQGSGMQLENSLVSIGSSGLTGHGYKKTPLYFPESGTDFIFSVYASNFGLFGALFLVILFIILDTHLITIAKNAKEEKSKYILSGFLFLLLYQQIQNMSMTLGILPITGITLPFISYGGSSLLSYFIMVGIILNINQESKRKGNTIYG